MIYELDTDQARALLAAGSSGHLGCLVDHEPYVVPIHYVFDGTFILGHTTPGRKLEGMRTSPRVCLQVEELHGEYRWRSVQAFGDFEELVEPEESERAGALLFARFPRLTPADAVRRLGHLGVPPVLFRIRLTRIAGVAEGEL